MGLESMHKRIENSDQVLEDAFVTTVHERIIEAMSEALEEVGFTPEQEQAFREYLASLPAEDINGILSLPYELRERRLTRLYERVKGGVSIPEIVDVLAQEARERGFTIGYHMSGSDILPREVKGQHATWTIDGREEDHRDNDLPMAYYSTNLASLYGKKRARFLYIVRAERGPGTTHRQDNDGSWGRATKLDIVEKLDYEAVMREARERSALKKEKVKA